MSWGRPKEPGELYADDTRYSIAHRSKFFEPWVVEAEPPTWRDLWAILRKRYRPRLKVSIRLSMEGTNRVLKDVWTAPRIEKQLADSTLLFSDLP